MEVPLPVTNKPGQGGGTALEYLAGERGGGRCAVHLLPAHMPGAFKWDHGLQLRGGHHAHRQAADGQRLLRGAGGLPLPDDHRCDGGPEGGSGGLKDRRNLRSLVHGPYPVPDHGRGGGSLRSGPDRVRGVREWRGGGQPHGRAHRRSLRRRQRRDGADGERRPAGARGDSRRASGHRGDGGGAHLQGGGNRRGILQLERNIRPGGYAGVCPGVLGEYAAGDDGDEGVAGDLQQVRMGGSLPGARGV